MFKTSKEVLLPWNGKVLSITVNKKHGVIDISYQNTGGFVAFDYRHRFSKIFHKKFLAFNFFINEQSSHK